MELTYEDRMIYKMIGSYEQMQKYIEQDKKDADLISFAQWLTTDQVDSWNRTKSIQDFYARSF